MSLYIPIVFSQIPQLRKLGVEEFKILDVLRKVAIRYTPIIQKSCPVDTGRLKASLRVELLIDRNGLAITSEVFYAGFVEFGTKKMSPRNYAQKHIPAIISEVLAALQNLTSEKLTQKPIQRFSNQESGLYSGITTQSLSEKFIGQVVNNLVKPKTVGSLTVSNLQVSGNRVESLEVSNMVMN